MNRGSVLSALLASSVSTSALCAGTAATAQSAAPSSTAIGEIVVTGVATGTRLSGFAAPTPVTVVGQVQLEQRGAVELSDVLDELPEFRASGPTQSPRTSTTTTGGQAQSNLRALGPTRTLTLIDGRRQVGSNSTGTIDTNRIPTNLVDRIDVVTGGASAAYGSDAVAGVVNIVLDRRLVGIRASAEYGVSQYDDDIQKSLNFAFGTKYAQNRGNFVFGLDYSTDSGVGNILTRPWGRLEPGQVQAPANRAAGVPAQLLLYNVETSNATPGSIITGATTNAGAPSTALNNIAFGPGGVPYQFAVGTVYGGAQMVGSAANYGICATCHYHLESAIERFNVLVANRLELNDHITLVTDASYGQLTTIGYVSAPITSGTIILRNNPFIPASVASAMDANNLKSITLGRYDTEGDALSTRIHNRTVQVNAGFEGNLFRDWKWDAGYSFGQTRTNFVLPSLPHQPDFAAASYVLSSPSGPVCGPLATNPNLSTNPGSVKAASKVLPGCVPFNIFGPPVAGDPALKYVFIDASSIDLVTQNVLSANLRGSPFSDWAGPVSLAVGGEWRQDTYSETSDPISQTSPYLFGNRTTTPKVGNTVEEGYAEIGVPLLRNLPVVKSADFNGAVRRTNYKISGAVTTWKVGLTYEVSDLLRFRGTLSHDIRAPTLVELYQFAPAQATNNAFANPFNGQTQVLISQGGGNSSLKPEVADTLTAGAVLTPKSGLFSALSLSVDYYKIKISGIIGTLAVGTIVSECLSGNALYCAQIEFGPNKFINNIHTGSLNLNHQDTNGVDFDLVYKVPVSGVGVPGRLDLRLLASYVGKLATTDIFNTTIDAAGTGQGLPTWAGTLSINYANGPYSISNQFRTFSSLRASPTQFGPGEAGYDPALSTSVNINTYPSVVYWNLSGTYDLVRRGTTDVQLFAVVDNVLNTAPPPFAGVTFSLGNYQAYDVIGRRFKMGVRVRY